jgi:hypothetical protein
MSIYLPGSTATEITNVSKHFGISASKLLRDAWILAKTYTGEAIPGTVLPLPPEIQNSLETERRHEVER